MATRSAEPKESTETVIKATPVIKTTGEAEAEPLSHDEAIQLLKQDLPKTAQYLKRAYVWDRSGLPLLRSEFSGGDTYVSEKLLDTNKQGLQDVALAVLPQILTPQMSVFGDIISNKIREVSQELELLAPRPEST
jgi:hypothetical protein